MRDATYNTLLQKRRQELHLATARAIAAVYPVDEYVEMIAYHYARSQRHDEAALWLERAGDRAAAIYAVESAVRHYREALRLIEEGQAEPLTVARLDEKAGRALYTGGRYDDALQRLEPAAEIYHRAGDLEAAGRVTAQMGMVHRWRGSAEDGVRLVQPMIEALEPVGPSPALASLHVALAQLQFLAGRYRDTLSAAARAAEVAQAIGDTRLLGEAEERRGTALTVLGRPEEGRRVLEETIPLLEESGNLAVLWRALNNAGYACEQQGRIHDQLRYVRRSLEVAERIGNPDEIAFVLGNLGDTLLTVGDWPAARASLERAMVYLQQTDHTVNAAYPMGFLGCLALREGRWDEAAGTLEEALELSVEAAARRAQEQVQIYLAELDLRRGQPEQARARLEPLAAEEDSDPGIAPALAWTYVELGNESSLERAAQIVAQVVNRSEEQGHHLPLVEAFRVQAMILTRRRRWAEAQRAFEEALRRARAVPHPYAEAQILYELGTALLERGESEAARAHLRDAERIFRGLGAQTDLERALQALGPPRPGDRRPRPDPAQPADDRSASTGV
jgi:adenylate cyclase